MSTDSYNIAIVGAGQLGSRHLQGLAKSSNQLRIYVVDPDNKALSLSEKRYLEVSKSEFNKVSYLQSIISLPSNLDIVIIATTADVRKQVVEVLLKSKSVTYLILEKIVFHRANDFVFIYELLKSKGTKAWINLPRRVYECYRRIKKEINGEIIKVKISGNNWGMASNSIHMVDLLAFLTDCFDISFDCSQLDNIIYPSKRNGFKEFRGKLSVSTVRGDILELFDQDSLVNGHIEISVPSIDTVFFIYEGQVTLIKQVSGKEKVKEKILIPFQSEITGTIVSKMLCHNQSELTPYTECMQYHVPMLEAFNDYLSKIQGMNIITCPIT